MVQNKANANNNDTKVWTIGRLLKWTQEYFTAKKIDSPRLDAEVLLAYVLQKERIYLYVHFDEPLQENELVNFRELIKKRATRLPIAYIIGQKEFMGMTFKVNKDVLVPRPETELLVEAVIDRLPSDKDVKFADIGTGSGAIAIALAKLRSNFSGCAVDISEKAIETAKINADALQVKDRIEFLQGDLLTPLYNRDEARKFNAIVSNPPYIPLKDMEGLQPEVRKYEPYDALTDKNDGLDFYRRLTKNGGELLTEDGFLACEIGIGQAEAIRKMAEENDWGRCEILKDLARIERVVVLWKHR